jgi:hypothetical protein
MLLVQADVLCASIAAADEPLVGSATMNVQ